MNASPSLRYVVLRQDGINEPHFDLMIETAPGSHLATWRSPVWPIESPTVSPLQMEVGTNNPAVVQLRQRLAAEGDLKVEPSGFWGPSYFDQDVSDALKRFQDLEPWRAEVTGTLLVIGQHLQQSGAFPK